MQSTDRYQSFVGKERGRGRALLSSPISSPVTVLREDKMKLNSKSDCLQNTYMYVTLQVNKTVNEQQIL